jgi:hypothetical protein
VRRPSPSPHKRIGPGQIGDAKGYQTDALLHLASIAVDHELCCHLYAATARRLPYTDPLTGLDESGKTAERVLKAALKRVTSCECGPETSCYGCLRSYENQRDHDQLSRGDALTLLTHLV